MLFKLGHSDGKPVSLNAVPFKHFNDAGHLEKGLEDLIASNLFDALFEDAALMPVFQERGWQAEADIYALNREGGLVTFELKRGQAGGGPNRASRRQEPADSPASGRRTVQERCGCP